MVRLDLEGPRINTRLSSLLAFNVIAILFLILFPSSSYTIARNSTIDDDTTTEGIGDGFRLEDTSRWRKATLFVEVYVVGGSAEVSDFLIGVSSSTSDDFTKWIQYPDEPFTGNEAGTQVTLRVSNTPSSAFNYKVAVVGQSNGDYSPAYEGCSGTWELAETKTCKITNYFKPQPLPGFQIVAFPKEMTVKPESSNYSTLTLIPSQDNSRDTIMNLDLDTEWVGTPPNIDDVSVTLEQSSIRLVGTERQDLGIAVQTSQEVPQGQTFTLSVRAEGEEDQQDHLVSHEANIQIIIPPRENTPPEAIATLDKDQVNEGGKVELDGTRSTYPDGDDLTYLWEIISGSDNGQISNVNSGERKLTFETPMVEENTIITLQLTVSDGKPGGTGIDRTQLRINDLGSDPNTGPTTNNPNTGPTTNNAQNRGDRIDPLTDTIPAEIRDIASGVISPVVEPSNDNILPLLILGAIIVVGAIAIAKYKTSRTNNRRLKISPSALVEIRTKGGMAR